MPHKRESEKTFPEIMNLAELMEYLRIGYSTAVKLLTSGEIPCKHLNREWRVCKADVIEWIRKPTAKEGA
jgi:excisionase family DNA binding protein